MRCGQCDEVFDANAHLQTLDETLLAQPTAPTQAPIDPVEESVAYAPAELPPQVEHTPSYDWGPVFEPDTAHNAAPEPSQAILQIDQGLRTPTPIEDPILHDAVPDAEHAIESLAPLADPFLGQNPHEESVEQTLDHAKLSFMEGGLVAPKARRWLGSKVLVPVCVVLALLLVLQYLIAERDMVAATSPALRPLLSVVCEPLHCKVSAPRQIESIAIESSTFTSMRPGVYVLSLALKNSASMDLATPALELTLTDMQDLPLFRRVLLPTQLGAVEQMAAGAELSISTPIGVSTNPALEKIAGYKLLAFYP